MCCALHHFAHSQWLVSATLWTSDGCFDLQVGQLQCPLLLVVGEDDQNYATSESAKDVSLSVPLSVVTSVHLSVPLFVPPVAAGACHTYECEATLPHSSTKKIYNLENATQCILVCTTVVPLPVPLSMLLSIPLSDLCHAPHLMDKSAMKPQEIFLTHTRKQTQLNKASCHSRWRR